MITPKRWYEAQIVIPESATIEAERRFECDFVGPEYIIRTTNYKVMYVAGDQLRQLIDLGYSEKQGVTMLDAIFPEAA